MYKDYKFHLPDWKHWKHMHAHQELIAAQIIPPWLDAMDKSTEREIRKEVQALGYHETQELGGFSPALIENRTNATGHGTSTFVPEG